MFPYRRAVAVLWAFALLSPIPPEAKQAPSPKAPPAAPQPTEVLIKEGTLAEDGLLVITPDLLRRWSISEEQFKTLPAQEKARTRKVLTYGERSRLRDLARLKALTGEAFAEFVTPLGWPTAEGRRRLEKHMASVLGGKAKAIALGVQADPIAHALEEEDFALLDRILDGSFDGNMTQEAEADSPLPVAWEVHSRNGQLKRIAVTYLPWNLTAEYGTLGIVAPSPLVDPSRYYGLRQEFASDSESWIDYRTAWQLAVVKLSARLYDERESPQVERFAKLAETLGLSERHTRRLRRYTRYDHSTSETDILVGSLLNQMGRAYSIGNMLGVGFDLGWSVSQLLRFYHAAPNAQTDGSVALRAKMGDDHNAALILGMTQDFSPVGKTLLQDIFTEDGVEAGLNVQQAPHLGLAFWGKLNESLKYSVRGRHSSNETTDRVMLETSLHTTFEGRPLSAGIELSSEKGKSGIDFTRNEAALRIRHQLSPRMRAVLSAYLEKIEFGSAEYDSTGIQLALEADLGGGKSSIPRGRVIFDALMERENYGIVGKERGPAFISDLNKAAKGAIKIADRAVEIYEGIEEGALDAGALAPALDRLTLELHRLSPSARQRLLSELSERGIDDRGREVLAGLFMRGDLAFERGANVNRDQVLSEIQEYFGITEAEIRDNLDDAVAWYGENRPTLRKIARLLGNKHLWNGLLLQAGRAALAEKVENTTFDVPGFGETQLDASLVLAAGAALNAKLGAPLAPLSKTDTKRFVQPWLYRELGEEFGADGVSTPEGVIGAVFHETSLQIRRKIRENLRSAFAATGDRSWTREEIVERLGGIDLPEGFAELVEQRFGKDFAGLGLPDKISPRVLDRKVIEPFLDGIKEDLRDSSAGRRLANEVAKFAAWSSRRLTDEVNLQLLQTLRAAEVLNEINVDEGRPLYALAEDFHIRSFEQLDARERKERDDAMDLLEESRKALARRLRDDRERQLREIRRAELLRQLAVEGSPGRRQATEARDWLENLQGTESWPSGLSIAVEDADWIEIESRFGKDKARDMVERLGASFKRHRAEPKTVRFVYDPEGYALSSSWGFKEGEVLIRMPGRGEFWKRRKDYFAKSADRFFAR